MLCENCGQREATIHEVLIDQSGSKVEKHLCEVCAGSGSAGEPGPIPVSALISKFDIGAGLEEAASQGATRVLICPECNRTFSQFKKHGLLGCPACYDAFEPKLGPLLERAHEGGTHHVGKVPRRALLSSRSSGHTEEVLGEASEWADRLTHLRKQLDSAVRAERYEEAGELKKEIDHLTDMLDKGGRDG